MGTGVAVGAGVAVGIGVAVTMGVAVGVGVKFGVGAGVGIGVAVIAVEETPEELEVHVPPISLIASQIWFIRAIREDRESESEV